VSPVSPELITKAREAVYLFKQALQDIAARENQDRMLAAWQMLLLDTSLNALDLSIDLFPELIDKEYVGHTLKLIHDGSVRMQALISQAEVDVLLHLNEAIEGIPEVFDIVYYNTVINDTNKLLNINDLISRRIDKVNKYGTGFSP